MKHIEFSRRNENQGVHVEFSVRRPSPPNTYSYVQEKQVESILGTRKNMSKKIIQLSFYSLQKQ